MYDVFPNDMEYVDRVYIVIVYKKLKFILKSF